MNIRATKKGKETRQSVANAIAQRHTHHTSALFEDNRPEAIAQRRLRALINNNQGQQQPPVQSMESNTGASVIQRKIMTGGKEYQAKESDHEKVTHAIGDEFIRDYEDEAEMQNHLVAGAPSSVGLIKKRALWYRIPHLPDTFFVFGESHAGVKGPDIKEASNIKKPILYEAYPGWNVEDYDKNGNNSITEDQGIDENSSKLARALEIWNPFDLLPSQTKDAPLDEIPKIPEGQKSTRKKEDGSYRLVVKGEDGKEKWWSEQGQNEPPANTYDSGKQALDAILELIEAVYGKNNDSDVSLKIYRDLKNKSFLKAWRDLTSKKWEGLPNNEAKEILQQIRRDLLEGMKLKMMGQYRMLKEGRWGNKQGPQVDSQVKDVIANTRALEKKTRPDDYRDEYMLASILKGKDSFAFAAIGNAHLRRLKTRLDAATIPYVSMEDFYVLYCADAVDIPDRRMPWEKGFAELEHLDLPNLITNQTGVLVKAVEEGSLPKLKKLTINEQSMTPDLLGRLRSCEVNVILTE